MREYNLRIRVEIGAAEQRCIRPGADADLLALDNEGVIQLVWTRGHLAYAAGDESAE